MKPAWAHAIGLIVTPDRVVLVNGLLKTRSGEILRRMLHEPLAKGMPPWAKR